MTKEIFWLVIGAVVTTIGILLIQWVDEDLGKVIGVFGIIIMLLALIFLSLTYSMSLSPTFPLKSD